MSAVVLLSNLNDAHSCLKLSHHWFKPGMAQWKSDTFVWEKMDFYFLSTRNYCENAAAVQGSW